jgi:hypothetical protein
MHSISRNGGYLHYWRAFNRLTEMKKDKIDLRYFCGLGDHLNPKLANDKESILKVAYVRCIDEFAVFNLN